MLTFSHLLKRSEMESFDYEDVSKYDYFVIVSLGLCRSSFDEIEMEALRISLEKQKKYLCLIYDNNIIENNVEFSNTLQHLLSYFKEVDLKDAFLGAVDLRKLDKKGLSTITQKIKCDDANEEEVNREMVFDTINELWKIFKDDGNWVKTHLTIDRVIGLIGIGLGIASFL